MKERPIIFSAPMVRAILEGRKTQTRRVCNGQRELSNVRDFRIDSCPYGQPGDRLWVREAWRTYASIYDIPPRGIAPGAGVQYEAGGSNIIGTNRLHGMGKLRPGMFMPRWASRITLEITGVRVERLQDISEQDAIAEGVEQWELVEQSVHWDSEIRRPVGGWWRDYLLTPDEEICGASPLESAACSYQSLWESINGPGTWDANPWAWVIEFKAVTP